MLLLLYGLAETAGGHVAPLETLVGLTARDRIPWPAWRMHCA